MMPESDLVGFTPNHEVVTLECNENSNIQTETLYQSEAEFLIAAVEKKKQQLITARKRKKEIEKTRQEILILQKKWLHRQNEAQRKQDLCMRQLESLLTRRLLTEERIQSLNGTNALNDCFHIWHRGVYGTINGLRLGTYVPPVTAAIGASDGNSTTSTSSFLEFDFTNLFLDPVGSANASDNNNNSASSVQSRVSWSEINAALGTAALLLATLQGIPHANISFNDYHIVPMGNFSKIVTKTTKTNPTATIYNLYSDDRFSFFGKRNFNGALSAFLQCVKDAADCLLANHNKSMTLPHSITKDNTGEMLIGGLTIIYGTDGERWTRALKYLLTDLKWLVAFVVKYVNR